jgi:hypothetical protein
MSLAPGLVRTTSSRLLTRANEPELKSQSESAYRVVKQRKVGAPDTIRTCDLCLRRASPPTSVVIVPLQDPQQPDQALSPITRTLAVNVLRLALAPSSCGPSAPFPRSGIAKFAAARLAWRYQQKYQQSGRPQWAFACIFNWS